MADALSRVSPKSCYPTSQYFSAALFNGMEQKPIDQLFGFRDEYHPTATRALFLDRVTHRRERDLASPTDLGWIAPRLLATEEIAGLRRAFDASPERLLVIDDFMDERHLDDIRPLLEGEGNVEEMFKLYGSSDWVDEEDFERAADDARFVREGIYQGPRKGGEMSLSVIRDQRMRFNLAGAAFRGWLTAVTGLETKTVGAINLTRLDRHHFLRWHTDYVPGRVLCIVLYLHRGWRRQFGGRLLIRRRDGEVDPIDPEFNRLVMFEAAARVEHAVEPMTEAAGDWSRCSYSVWFRDGSRRRSMASPVGQR